MLPVNEIPAAPRAWREEEQERGMGPALFGGWVGGGAFRRARALERLRLAGGTGGLQPRRGAPGAGHRGVAADRDPPAPAGAAAGLRPHPPAVLRKRRRPHGGRRRKLATPYSSRLTLAPAGEPRAWRGSCPESGAPSVIEVTGRRLSVQAARSGRLRRVAAPGAVEGAGAVDALEAVRAEEVALRLQQVGGGAAGAHHVEVAERRRQRRRGDARQRRLGDHAAEARRGCGSASRRSGART